jgi:hypothetical protein
LDQYTHTWIVFKAIEVPDAIGAVARVWLRVFRRYVEWEKTQDTSEPRSVPEDF